MKESEKRPNEEKLKEAVWRMLSPYISLSSIGYVRFDVDAYTADCISKDAADGVEDEIDFTNPETRDENRRTWKKVKDKNDYPYHLDQRVD